MLAREEKLGCRHDASLHGRHTRINTSVGRSICYFLVFYDIKIYMYYVFKSIYIIKGTLVVNFALAWRCQRGFLDQLVNFKEKD